MPHVSTAMFAKTYGPILSFRIVSQNGVGVSSAEAVMEVLKTQDHNLSGRILPDVLRQPIKNFYLIWSPDCNDYWKSLRSHCQTNMFSVKAIEAQSKLRSEKLTQMRDFLEKKQGKVGLDIQGLRRDYTKNNNQISSFTEKLIDERREWNSTGAIEALLEAGKEPGGSL
ncbi:cytochrome P450, partial [Tanacetum coccineum]